MAPSLTGTARYWSTEKKKNREGEEEVAELQSTAKKVTKKSCTMLMEKY